MYSFFLLPQFCSKTRVHAKCPFEMFDIYGFLKVRQRLNTYYFIEFNIEIDISADHSMHDGQVLLVLVENITGVSLPYSLATALGTGCKKKTNTAIVFERCGEVPIPWSQPGTFHDATMPYISADCGSGCYFCFLISRISFVLWLQNTPNIAPDLSLSWR